MPTAAPPDYLSVAASIVGMLLGTAGFVISILAYLRDRPRVKIRLTWEMQDTQTGKRMGLIRVTNIGRRPVFISVVALELPKGFRHSHLIMAESVGGTKIGESEKPYAVVVPYNEELARYSEVWRKMRAYAEDSTDKRYYSEFPRKDAPTPSWVKAPTAAAPGAREQA